VGFSTIFTSALAAVVIGKGPQDLGATLALGAKAGLVAARTLPERKFHRKGANDAPAPSLAYPWAAIVKAANDESRQEGR